MGIDFRLFVKVKNRKHIHKFSQRLYFYIKTYCFKNTLSNFCLRYYKTNFSTMRFEINQIYTFMNNTIDLFIFLLLVKIINYIK